MDGKEQTSVVKDSDSDLSYDDFREPQKRHVELENLEKEQDLELKKITLDRLFRFLAIETIAVFLIALLQGFNLCGFNLDEWSLRTLLVVTIAQITAMLMTAVRHLFPNKK